jgi:hypothetical protein
VLLGDMWRPHRCSTSPYSHLSALSGEQLMPPSGLEQLMLKIKKLPSGIAVLILCGTKNHVPMRGMHCRQL